MIYIFANSGPEATKFAIRARLHREPVQLVTSGSDLGELTSFEEDDEVFALDVGSAQKQFINKIYGQSWPRPHLIKFLDSTAL